MSRSVGLSVFSSNFETRVAAPLDSRMLVDALADLHATATWQSGDGSYYAYKGMLVCVCNDTEENNGVYRLAALPYTTSSNWVKLGSGTGTGFTWYPDDAPPDVPEIGDAYHSSTAGASLVWDGTEWQTVAVDGTDGNDGQAGEDGQDGANGVTPHIDAGGNWFIGEADTGIPAQGPAGEDGSDGAQGLPGEDGTNGVTPHIDETNGNWFIGEDDTGIPATGPAGADGADGEDGAQGVAGQDGANGVTPQIGLNGNWFIGEADTGIPAQGPAGNDGEDGAQGVAGQDGANGTSSYTYWAYASDGSGTGFSLTTTPEDALYWVAQITVSAPLNPPTASDFSAATWVKYRYTPGEFEDAANKVTTIDAENPSSAAYTSESAVVGYVEGVLPAPELPDIAAGDDGKMLAVVEGAWAKSDAPVSATTANVQSALGVDTGAGSESRALSEKGTFVDLPAVVPSIEILSEAPSDPVAADVGRVIIFTGTTTEDFISKHFYKASASGGGGAGGYLVSGAGMTAVNGVYEPTGETYNSQPVYTMVSGETTYYLYYQRDDDPEYGWVIYNEKTMSYGPDFYAYYYCKAAIDGTWSVGKSGGSSPAPTVAAYSPYSWDDVTDDFVQGALGINTSTGDAAKYLNEQGSFIAVATYDPVEPYYLSQVF